MDDLNKEIVGALVDVIGKATKCKTFVKKQKETLDMDDIPKIIFDFWNIDIRKDVNDFDKGFLDLMLSIVDKAADNNSDFWKEFSTAFDEGQNTMQMLTLLNSYTPVTKGTARYEGEETYDWKYSLKRGNEKNLETEGTKFEEHFCKVIRTFPLHIAKLFLPVGFDRYHAEKNTFAFQLQAQPDFNNRRIKAKLVNPDDKMGLFDVISKRIETNESDGDEIQSQQIYTLLASRTTFDDLQEKNILENDAKKEYLPPFFSMFDYPANETSNEPDYKFNPELLDYPAATKPSFQEMCNLFRVITVSQRKCFANC